MSDAEYVEAVREAEIRCETVTLEIANVDSPESGLSATPALVKPQDFAVPLAKHERIVGMTELSDGVLHVWIAREVVPPS